MLYVVQKTIKQLPKTHKMLLSGLAAVVLVATLLPSERVSATRQAPTMTLEVGKRYDLSLDVTPGAEDQIVQFEDQDSWQSYKVRKGDNLSKLFKRAGLTAQETYHVSKAGKQAKQLLNLKPGEQIAISKSPDGRLQELTYDVSVTETLHVKRKDDKFITSVSHKSVDKRLDFAQGEIVNSFWNAGKGANLTDNQIMSLAGIFGWDIDFALEIRQGDSFNVVFEKEYIDGEFVGFGDIVAAEFVNQGETFTAIRHTDGNYYTPEGRSMRKSFLRAPVNFKYISSSFKKRRFHPVQKRWKAHRGVDYAANRGTPVMAAGDGKVIKAAYDKYNGHHVFIQHGEKYTTKYLHFTKRKVKKGQYVKQGQIIGTVGSTGLASGPHLHYEFLVDGVHRNPRTVKLPKARPIAKKDANAFRELAALRMEQLSNTKRIMLAMN